MLTLVVSSVVISTHPYAVVFSTHGLDVLRTHPASDTAAWCGQGAPLVIKTEYSELAGILPECKPGDVEDPESLVTDFDSFINYSGIEDDPDIISAVKGYVESNFLGEFNSLKGCEAYLGGPPVLNKLGKVVRHKWCGKTSRWITKNRLIMN